MTVHLSRRHSVPWLEWSSRTAANYMLFDDRYSRPGTEYNSFLDCVKNHRTATC
jgi:hypothetical protein